MGSGFSVGGSSQQSSVVVTSSRRAEYTPRAARKSHKNVVIDINKQQKDETYVQVKNKSALDWRDFVDGTRGFASRLDGRRNSDFVEYEVHQLNKLKSASVADWRSGACDSPLGDDAGQPQSRYTKTTQRGSSSPRPIPTPRKPRATVRRNLTFNSVPGHEHPYSIKMNSVRNAARADGGETPGVSDQDVNDNDVQFIFRENKKMSKKSSFGKCSLHTLMLLSKQ